MGGVSRVTSRHSRAGLLLLLLALVGCTGQEERPASSCEGVDCGPGRCVLQEGQATCDCEPGTRPQGMRCVADEAPAAASCTPSPAPPRRELEREPGGTPDTALALPGEPLRLTGSFEQERDVDMFSFPATAGHAWAFTCTPLEAAADCSMVLSDSLGHQLSANTVGATSRLLYKFSTTGTYFLRLASPALGRYELLLEGPLRDDHGDTPATATAVGLSSPPLEPGSDFALFPPAGYTPGTLELPWDVDVLSFTPEPGHAYEFECITPRRGVDCNLALLGQEGRERTVDKGENPWARIAWEFDSAGPFFFRIQSGNLLAGEYAWRLRDLGVDDHGDGVATATPVVPYEPPPADPEGGEPPLPSMSAALETNEDSDVFSFTAEAGRVYALEVESTEGMDFSLGVLDEQGRQLAVAARQGRKARLAYEFDSAGTWYFRVYTGIPSRGRYVWRLLALGRDDHGDTRTTATRVVPFKRPPLDPTQPPPEPEPNKAALEAAGDVDMLSFTAEAGHVYALECNGLGSVDCNVELLEPEGRVLASDLSERPWARVAYEFPTSGTWLLRIRSRGQLSGPYTWLLRDLGKDDHGDTLATATRVQPAREPLPGQPPLEPVMASLETPGDVDVLSFTAEAGHLYALECTDTSGIDCNVELREPEGRVLASDVTGRRSARLVYESGAAGQLFLRLFSGNAATGSYTWLLRDLGADDYGDSALTATRVQPTREPAAGEPPPRPNRGSLETPGDVDVFAVAFKPGHTYVFECGTRRYFDESDVARYGQGSGQEPGPEYEEEPLRPGSTPVPTCELSLLDWRGIALLKDTSRRPLARIAFAASDERTYFFRVRPADKGNRPYLWRLFDLGEDDHGDTVSTATRVEPADDSNRLGLETDEALLKAEYGAQPEGPRDGTTLVAPLDRGRLEDPEDVDFFMFTAEAGRVYAFSCVTEEFNCNVYLQERTGQVLAWDTRSERSARLVHEFSATGTYWLRVERGGPLYGAYRWRLSVLKGDDVGDSVAAATQVAPGYDFGRMDAFGDVDVYSFTPQAGQLYEIECRSRSFDCNLELFDPRGKVVASDYGSQRSARVVYEFDTERPYFFRIFSGNQYVGRYAWVVRRLERDDHGDTPATATQVTAYRESPGRPGPEPLQAQVETPRDVDVFAFTAEAGHIYAFECESLSGFGGLDCNLYLADPEGRVLASDKRGRRSARIAYEINEAGSYTFQVFSGNLVTGAYTWRLVDLGRDDHGDTQSTATRVEPSAPGAGASEAMLELPTDVDVYAFTVEEGHVYAMECSGDESLGCRMELLSSLGSMLDSDAGTKGAARIAREAGSASTWYLRIRTGGPGSGAYTWRVVDLGRDDHGDTLSTATKVEPDVHSAALEAPGDEDWFSFSARAGHVFNLACDASFDCRLLLLDGRGQSVVTDSSNKPTASVVHKLAASGVYYVKIAAVPGAYGSYFLEISDKGKDDHGDTYLSATAIEPGTSLAAQKEVGQDMDFFSVCLSPDTTYSVTTKGLSTTITAYGPDGRTVRASGPSPLTFTSGPAGGTHYLRVQGLLESETGTYWVRVE